MSQSITCKLCMNTPKKNATTKINALPKTFTFMLEEMSGVKFSKADSLNMVICMKCLNFLKNMENSSTRPKSNKITESGKKRVFKLMEKKRVPAAQAIEIVLAEQRARELLIESGIKVPNAGDAEAKQQKPIANPVDLPVASLVRRKLSGAQRKKVNILIDAGMEPEAARQLVYAASLANQTNQQGNAPNQVLNMQRPNEQRGRGDGRQRQQNPQRPGPQNATGQRNNLPKGGADQIGKAKPIQKPPVQRVAPVKAAPEKPGPGSKGRNQNITASPGILLPQKMRQNRNNSGGGRGSNAVKRVGAIVPPGRNERHEPYNINRRQNQSQRQQNQSQRQQNQPQRQQNQPKNQNMQNISNFQNMQNMQNKNFNEPQHQTISFEVGIVPINYPTIMLDDLKLDALKEAITNEILKIPQGGPLIRFLGTSSENGWLKVICADELSRNWLAMLVERWERAGVRMVEGNSMPQPAILTFYLQGDFRSPDEILSIIDKQNIALNSKQWRVINRESDDNGQRITICVDDQCFQALRSRDFMVFLGLGVVELKPRRSASDDISFNNNSSSQNFSGNDNNFGNTNMQGDGREKYISRNAGRGNYKSDGHNFQWGGGYNSYDCNW